MRRSLSSPVGRACALVVSSLVLAAPAVAADYVALGDSFSSGVGTGSYTLSSSCYRGTYAYPWLVHLQRPTLSFDFAACSGAKTTDVLASQMQAVTSGTTLVTVTAGGNDIGFSSLITQCTLGNCSAALDATRASLPTVLAPRLLSLYAKIKATAPVASRVIPTRLPSAA